MQQPATITPNSKESLMNHIEDATKKDAKQIVDIRIRARKEWYQWIISQTHLDSLICSPKRIQKYKEIIESDTSIVLISKDQWVVNWFLYGGIWRDKKKTKLDEIYAFYVNPECQRKWIGSKLFNEFLKRSSSKSIYLRTLPWSKWESFYKKQWWKPSWKRKIEIWWGIYNEIRYSFEIAEKTNRMKASTSDRKAKK